MASHLPLRRAREVRILKLEVEPHIPRPHLKPMAFAMSESATVLRSQRCAEEKVDLFRTPSKRQSGFGADSEVRTLSENGE